MRQRKVTARQSMRFKFSLIMFFGLTFLCFVFGQDDYKYFYQGEDYIHREAQVFSRGEIVEYSNKEVVCASYILLPGINLFSDNFLAVLYCLALIYLFLGISIVSDIFMGSIEQITAKTRIVKVDDPETGKVKEYRVRAWNPTIANLTLMALGSSAPEILLSVIETLQTLGKKPGELGPSTIVGSAAFNLLVISGISILAVSDGHPKKIFDMGVFAVTCTASFFAYIWLYLVLMVISKDEVEIWEAGVTLLFFFILLGAAFAADKYNESKQKKIAKEEKAKRGNTDEDDDNWKPTYAAADFYKVLLADKERPQNKVGGSEDTQVERDLNAQKKEMKTFLKKLFKTDQIEQIDYQELKEALEGPSMLPRLQFRKQVANFISGKKQIVIKKGEVLRKEHKLASTLDEHLRNDDVGFRCLHYSVSEGSGFIAISIVNKKGKSMKIGARTVEGDAKEDEDYQKLDIELEFTGSTPELEIKVTINDDDEWEPDEDFYVELYDIATGIRLQGEDTKCTVTIIDDDKPGTLSFESRSIKVIASTKLALVKVVRQNGCDGKISCEYKTITLDDTSHTATPGKDFEHKEGTLYFIHGETVKIIEVPIIEKEGVEKRDEMFGVKIMNALPDGVKISKKDTCFVEIVTDEEGKKRAEAIEQILNMVKNQEQRSWCSQFKTACMLHPQKNEDGEIEDITCLDAIFHFLSIGWKVLFACIPPPHLMGGWLAFVIALAFIGLVTAIVGEFATLFGCVLGIKPAVTAITFVALGTSLPDTFASKQAAQESEYADSAIGNVTGSNSVNVFLGLGLPWCMATYYYREHENYEGDFYYKVPAGSLGFSVMLFLMVSVVCVCILMGRRILVGGELGGPPTSRNITAGSCISLWLIYVLLSTLQVYDVIEDPLS